jgi:hypothetical protein
VTIRRLYASWRIRSCGEFFKGLDERVAIAIDDRKLILAGQMR